MCKLDGALRELVSHLEKTRDATSMVNVVVACGEVSEAEMAALVQEQGGNVLELMPMFHVFAAQIPIHRVEVLASHGSVQEVNLTRRHIVA